MTRTFRRIEAHRLGDAVLQVHDAAGRLCSGLPVWVEQESQAFRFGCVVPNLDALPEADRTRYRARLGEVFNHLEPTGRPPATDALRVSFPDRLALGLVRRQLDLSAGKSQRLPLDVHVRGETLGMPAVGERESAHLLGELYTLCFAEPGVRGIFWNGFWDGELTAGCGLLRRDFSPRPAFRVLQKLVDVVWHTRASGVTDADGLFRFRGFFGDYRVGVQAGEHVQVTPFSLRRPPLGCESPPFLVAVLRDAARPG